MPADAETFHLQQVQGAIRNPQNPHHFMVIQPVGRLVRLWWEDTLLAETKDAFRVLEISNKVYEPRLYVPMTHVKAELTPVVDKKTHCPLKGDASYHALDGKEIGWSYDRTFEFAEALRGRIAFAGNKLRTEEG